MDKILASQINSDLKLLIQILILNLDMLWPYGILGLALWNILNGIVALLGFFFFFFGYFRGWIYLIWISVATEWIHKIVKYPIEIVNFITGHEQIYKSEKRIWSTFSDVSIFDEFSSIPLPLRFSKLPVKFCLNI